MFLSAQLRRLTLCRLIGSQWRRDHRQPDCGLAPPENVAFEVPPGLFGWRKAADSPVGRRASSACRVTSGLKGLDGPSERSHSVRERASRAGSPMTHRRPRRPCEGSGRGASQEAPSVPGYVAGRSCGGGRRGWRAVGQRPVGEGHTAGTAMTRRAIPQRDGVTPLHGRAVRRTVPIDPRHSAGTR